MSNGPSDLGGLRVLLVEDNLLLAEVISDALATYGCVVVGPAPDVESGLQLAREAQFDGALLDINLFGDFCFPIAAVLTERKIPFLFLTGYDNSRLIPPEFRSARRLSKPIDPDALSSAISEHFRAPSVH